MDQIKTDMVLDAKGLACPMPIVKTKKAMNELESGQVVLVEATDKGSKADIKAWAEKVGHQYLGTIEEGELLRHYLRKASEEPKEETKYSNVIDNEELAKQLENEDIQLVDVREYAEFAFNHIPKAISIPLGELEVRLAELKKDKQTFVICRTGNRSDLAAQKLTDKGFKRVINVVPGMSEWSGETEKTIN